MQNVKKARREFSLLVVVFLVFLGVVALGRIFPARRKIKIPRLSHSRLTGLEIRGNEVMIKETGISP